MSNRIVTPLELFVTSYLRTHSRKQIGKDFVRKSLALVDEKLGVPCCLDPTESINLFTLRDNELSKGVRAMLLNMSRKGNINSLNRVHRILYKFLNPPCCV